MNLDVLLDLIGNWKKKKDILKEANEYFTSDDPDREWRKYVENWNREYEAHLTNGYYIAHSNKGYKITQDREAIKQSLMDNHKRSINMLAKESRTLKAMGEDLCVQDLREEIDLQMKKSTCQEVNN